MPATLKHRQIETSFNTMCFLSIALMFSVLFYIINEGKPMNKTPSAQNRTEEGGTVISLADLRHP